MGEALASILAAITNAYINVVFFFVTLIQERNYIALAAVFVTIILAGTAIGKGYKKLKLTR